MTLELHHPRTATAHLLVDEHGLTALRASVGRTADPAGAKGYVLGGQLGTLVGVPVYLDRCTCEDTQ